MLLKCIKHINVPKRKKKRDYLKDDKTLLSFLIKIID